MIGKCVSHEHSAFRNPTAITHLIKRHNLMHIQLLLYCFQQWDRSHFLENLSGFETRCAMITSHGWDFSTSTHLAKQRGMLIEGKYGSAENTGSTTDAMLEVLEDWSGVS